MVERKCGLPDLSPQLSGLQRRRHRRPAGHHPPSGLPERAGCGRAVDLTLLQIPRPGQRLRHQRLSGHPGRIRNHGRLRPSAGRSPCPGPAGGHRSGGESHLQSAPLVHRKPLGPPQFQTGLLHLAGRQKRRPAQQLGLQLLGQRLDAGPDHRSVLPAHLRRFSARPELGQSCRSGGSFSDDALVVQQGSGRLPHGCHQHDFQDPRDAGRRAEARQPVRQFRPLCGQWPQRPPLFAADEPGGLVPLQPADGGRMLRPDHRPGLPLCQRGRHGAEHGFSV